MYHSRTSNCSSRRRCCNCLRGSCSRSTCRRAPSRLWCRCCTDWRSSRNPGRSSPRPNCSYCSDRRIVRRRWGRRHRSSPRRLHTGHRPPSGSTTRRKKRWRRTRAGWRSYCTDRRCSTRRLRMRRRPERTPCSGRRPPSHLPRCRIGGCNCSCSPRRCTAPDWGNPKADREARPRFHRSPWPFAPKKDRSRSRNSCSRRCYNSFPRRTTVRNRR